MEERCGERERGRNIGDGRGEWEVPERPGEALLSTPRTEEKASARGERGGESLLP